MKEKKRVELEEKMEGEIFFVAGYTSSDVPYGFTIKKEEYIITDVEDDFPF
ncbi:hypothetical protein [Bacillus andreraoultii]|uniref:hypothetical protein n=1 Tax=Bacillus andreraoultii TaxID=1499685 RepID=UPI000AB546F3|nr:hypothetical protein [Bacillus andreraoultii]